MNIKKIAAFSLIEMAIALSILGAMLAVALPLISNHYAGQSVGTQKSIVQNKFTEIDNVLIAFAKQHYRLPCPAATINSGVEDCSISNGLGFLPYKTLGYNSFVKDGYLREFRYSVYRQPANKLDLAAASNATDRYAPVLAASSINTSYYNDLDFCQALRTAQTQSFDSDYVHGTHDATKVNTAYVLASSGAKDANQNGVNGLYDGVNENNNNQFDSTANIINSTYDDYVHALSFAEFSGRLGCGAITVGVSSMANIAINAWGQSEIADDAVRIAKYDVDVANFNANMATVAIVMSVINAGLIIAHGLLASAMATAADPTSAATFVSIGLEAAASAIEIAATITAKVQASKFFAFAEQALRNAEGAQHKAVSAEEVILIQKAFLADFRGGTTR